MFSIKIILLDFDKLRKAQNFIGFFLSLKSKCHVVKSQKIKCHGVKNMYKNSDVNCTLQCKYHKHSYLIKY